MENSTKMIFSDEKILVRAMLQILAPLTVGVGIVYTAILMGFSLLTG